MAVICLSQPLILLPSVAMLALFFFVRRFYVATSRSEMGKITKNVI